jgi:hypothetical protein
MNNPLAVNLTGLAPTLTGNGFIFKFAVEHGNVFEAGGDNIAVLNQLFLGITIDTETLEPANIEFSMSDLL